MFWKQYYPHSKENDLNSEILKFYGDQVFRLISGGFLIFQIS